MISATSAQTTLFEELNPFEEQPGMREIVARSANAQSIFSSNSPSSSVDYSSACKSLPVITQRVLEKDQTEPFCTYFQLSTAFAPLANA